MWFTNNWQSTVHTGCQGKDQFVQLFTSSVDCGVPGNPQHGSLESNTGTTEGSVVFYSCDQHLVPEGRMMANCTRNGWSPNPEDLNCTEGMYVFMLWLLVIIVSIKSTSGTYQ